MNKENYAMVVQKNDAKYFLRRNKVNFIQNYEEKFTNVRKKIFKLEKDMESMIVNASNIRKKFII